MRKHLFIAALLLSTLGVQAADSGQPMPSNWGGWQNLTYGITDATYESTSFLPMQVEMSGNSIHLLWFEKNKDADGLYRMYYRRSADLGRTWEAAQVVGTSHEPQTESGYYQYEWMAVSGNSVHIIAIDKNGYAGPNSVNYVCSTDGGKTFTKRTLRQQGSGDYRPHIAADGQTVALAFSEYPGSGNYHQYVYSSLDGGETFTETKIEQHQNIADLKVTGNRWILMGYGDGKLYITTSDDGGRNYVTKNIAHVAANGKSYVELWTPFKYSHMSVDGNNVNVVYRGSLSNGGEGEPNPSDDLMHTIFQRSTDGGQTWQEPIYLEGTCGIEPNTIVSKGNDIYVYTCTGSGADGRTGRDAHPTIFYSHDGGKTWATQNRALEVYRPGIPKLTIDPNDSQHVILTGQRAFYLESKDGFRTIAKNFFIGSQANIRRDWNNNALQVFLDSEGTQHWFMHYSATDPAKADYEGTPWNIVYRRAERPVASGSTNMAFDIAKLTNEPDHKAINPAYIPMTTSLEDAAEAITVECWVRPDNEGFQIIGMNNQTDGDAHGSGYNGFHISVGKQWQGKLVFSTQIQCEKSENMGSTIETAPYLYATDTWGLWHHVAMTYDSHLTHDNFCFYVDGMLIGTRNEAGKILMGNKAICIGRVDQSIGEDQAKGLIDNVAIYNRALTAEEIHQHLYNTPDATDKDCRLLFTFDGTLRDLSQYQNDAVPLTPNILTETEAIRPPHSEFTLTKDMAGLKVYANDVTLDGEAYWWIMTNKWNPTADPTTSDKRHLTEDYSGHPGTYRYWMVARGNGTTTNACAAVQQTFTVGGLSRVFPDAAGQDQQVRLQIVGGYTLNYDNQPRVVLKQGSTEIEGKWDLNYGYDSRNVTNPDDLAPASFPLANAPLGKYDVIVGTDTLRQAFTLEKGAEPDVWMQVNSRELMIWNRYQRFTIDYGNRSNVAAYNTPMFLIIPDRHGTVDVLFDFDFYLCDPALDDNAQQLAQQLGEYLMAYDEELQDSIRVYSFMIPYIGPNSSEQRAFRMVMKSGSGMPTDNIKIGYWTEQPWGPYDPDAATNRAPYTLEQGECFAMEWGRVLGETAIGFIPGASCIYSIGKNGYNTAMGAGGQWSTLFTNLLDVTMNCAEELIPGAQAVQAAWKLASLAYKFYSAYNDINSMRDCLNGDPNSRNNRGVGSIDPNEIFGPDGPDEQAHYIQPIGNMAYTVTFENKSSATAPANEVFVTDTLDLTKFDAETFTFSSFGWADTTLVVGGSKTQQFTRDVAYKVNGHDILIRVSGQYDPAKGIARWSFVSLEANGDELDNPMNGFLLPNDDTGRGEGFVTFAIDHLKNPASGSTIANRATIIFDANEPITTNTYVNTFDTDYPTSRVTNAEERDGQLVITIEGNDKTSGIDCITLYAQTNGGEWETIATVADGSPVSTVTIACDPGTTYTLCALATDRVGWNEPKNLKAEATLTTSGSSTQTINVDVAATGYATFYDATDNYQLPAGLNASVVSGVRDGRLTYQTLNGGIIPKGTAVLIEAADKRAATYTLTSVADGSPVGTNLLHGSDQATYTNTEGSNLYYKLAYGPSGTSLEQAFGWFWGAQQGAPFRIEGHRAWLAVPSSAAARCYLMTDEATGLNPVTSPAHEGNDSYYSIDGCRHQGTPTRPGVYFHNGRKMVVK